MSDDMNVEVFAITSEQIEQLLNLLESHSDVEAAVAHVKGALDALGETLCRVSEREGGKETRHLIEEHVEPLRKHCKKFFKRLGA